MNRQIKIQVWNTVEKQMSAGMSIPMLAGYLTAIYPNLGNEIFRQFTGLKDRNDIEIYEGDILEFGVKTKVGLVAMRGVIEFNEKLAQFGVTKETPLDLPEHIESYESESGRPLILGNIYQNPELLK